MDEIMEKESLILKWGNVKGWDIKTDAMREALQEFFDLGRHGAGAMRRLDDVQKEALCRVIDVTDGEIWNDWDGVAMTKPEAKSYVREYGA